MGCNEDIGWLTAAMEENIYLTEFHEKKGNAKKLLELDNRFHEGSYDGGSRKLMEGIKDYHEYVGRVRKVTFGEKKEPKTPLTSINRYARQLDKNHDALLAEKCAREHINNSKENMEHPWLGKPY